MKTMLAKHKHTLSIFGGFILLNIAILAVNVTLGVGPNMVMKWIGASEDVRAYVGSTFSYGLRLLAYITLPALALQKVLGINPWPSFFPLRVRYTRQDLLFGFALVAGVLAAFFILAVGLGGLALDGWTWQRMPAAAWLRVVWVGFLVNLCVAVGEETIFRGYLLTGLINVCSRWKALLAMAAVFGVMHLIAYTEGGLQDATLTLAILLASLFGVLFGLVRLRTGSLWLPVILHFAWNFFETDVFNLTGDGQNFNLVGALTHLQEPLTMTRISPGNIVVLEMLAFAVIAFGLWLWLRQRKAEVV